MIAQRTEHPEWVLGNVHWNKVDGGFEPLFKWKSINFTGPPRPFKAFLEGERMTVLRYFMCRISEHLFDAAPLKIEVNETTGAFRMVADEDWDKLPELVETEDSWMMSDGTMEIAKAEPALSGIPDLADLAKEEPGESPHNWPGEVEGCEMRACPKCGVPFIGSSHREVCYPCSKE